MVVTRNTLSAFAQEHRDRQHMVALDVRAGISYCFTCDRGACDE